MNAPLLFSVQNISVNKSHRRLLDSISFDLQHGECVAILGLNGAGKSTLLHALCGSEPLEHGKILLNHQDIRTLSSAQLATMRAVVEQDHGKALGLTVRDVLESLACMDKHPEHARLIDILQRLTLMHTLTQSHASLSGGERAKVALARALWQLLQSEHGLKNKVLLLDEPSSALDFAAQETLFHYLRELNQTEQLSIISIVHDLNVAAFYFERVLIVQAGVLIADGHAREMLTPCNIERIWGQKVAEFTQTTPPFRRIFMPI